MKFLSSIVFSFFVLIASYTKIFASDSQFVTVVNPVRISSYNPHPKESLTAQYAIIKKLNFPATWLLTYDAISNGDVSDTIKHFDENQEFGIFFEVSPDFSKDAHVIYHDTGSWHHANSVFLSGYTQEERKQLIDTVFEKFRSVFGYYPKSVGGWWVDSFSLAYMIDKYGITADLGCSDQFETDGYKIWGQYWSKPFYPSIYHSGVPASTKDNKLDVVTIQWAPRDPLNGYKSSLYSTQDYMIGPLNMDTGYFEKLLNLYTNKGKNGFSQITLGLESDLSPEAYSGEFSKQMELVSRKFKENEVQPVKMSDFSQWYRDQFQDVSPSQIIETEDLLGSPTKIVWYQSPKYRIGITNDQETGETKVFDLRTYSANFQEPYYETPNGEFDLSVYIPSYFDEAQDSSSVWKLDLGNLKSEEVSQGSLLLKFGKGEIVLNENDFLIDGTSLDLPKILRDGKDITITDNRGKIEVKPKGNWIVGREGFIFTDLTDVATHALQTKRMAFYLLLGFFVFILLNLLIIRSGRAEVVKVLLALLVIVIYTITFYLWFQKNTMKYYASQAEIDALVHLASLPDEKVLVENNECLGCSWSTSEKPAVFSNKRSYVRKWGKHPIVYNNSVFDAKDQMTAREEFQKTGANYIYVSKYGHYIEKVPFSPGDLGIEKIYDSANAELWKIIDK